MKVFKRFSADVEKILEQGGVGVIPTDTIYGIVGLALSRGAVSRIYRLRHRRPDKPMIILIGSLNDLESFGVKLDKETGKAVKKLWPGKVSILLPCPLKKFSYLHRETEKLAFRLPAKSSLRRLLGITGPLVAPSANLEGKPPAKTIMEAKKYFGEGVDFYIDSGRLVSKPSTLAKFNNGKIAILRQGTARVRKRK